MHEALQQLDAATRAKALRERDAEWARRGALAAAVYPLLAASFWFATNHAQRLPALFMSVIGATSLLGVYRWLLSRRFERDYPRNPSAWRRRYAFTSIATALSWGSFAAGVLAFHKGHWFSALLVFSAGLMTSAFAATHAADKRLVSGYLTAMFTPLAAVTLSTRDEFSRTLAVCMLVFALYEIAMTRRAHNAYWQRVADRLMLESRAAELERTRQQAKQAQALKQTFLANMSHEVRTPLHGMLGLLAALRDMVREPSQRQTVDDIERLAAQLCRLFDQLLAVSCLDSGALELRERTFDPVEEIERIALEHASSASQRGVELVLDLDPSLPEALRTDPCRFAHVVEQLVANAVKFTDRGRVEISARVHRFTADDIDLRLEVADTGPGIAQADRERIFERFVQLDPSNTRRHGGIGLGLALARELAHAMGAKLHVESGLERPDGTGYGARFVFEQRLPWLRARGQSGPTPAGNFVGLRAAVLDDCPAVRRVLAERLSGWGARVDQFTEPHALLELGALAARAGEPLELLIIDLDLGTETDCDGLRVAEQIREMAWGQEVELVLLVPAHRSEPDAARLAALGFEATLRKPIRTSVLYETLAVYRSRRRENASNPKRTESNVAAPAPKSPRRLRILIAEDNPINQRVAVRMLEKLGHQCEVANDGRAAVQALEKGRYDVVLMDCQMPELDGFEATRRIRALERRSNLRTFVIAMTAHTHEAERERCFAAGMDGFVSKPVDTHKLLAELERLLPQRP